MNISAAQLHGTKMAGRLDQQTRNSLGIKTPEEIQAKIDKEGEKELQRLAGQLLTLRGIPFVHLSTRVRESAGWPDLTFSLNGHFIAVELKTKAGKLSEDQIGTLTKLVSSPSRAQCHVCRTFVQFMAILDGGGVVVPDETLWKREIKKESGS